MDNRKLYFLVSIFITIVVLMLLITGSSVLNVNLAKQSSIPLGTFITWAGMVSFPLSLYWGIKRLRKPNGLLTRFLSSLLKIIIVMGILWVPISYLLAGNLSFSFSEKDQFKLRRIAKDIAELYHQTSPHKGVCLVFLYHGYK